MNHADIEKTAEKVGQQESTDASERRRRNWNFTGKNAEEGQYGIHNYYTAIATTYSDKDVTETNT